MQCLKSECDDTIHLGNYRAGPTNDQMAIIKYVSILQPWLLITGVLWTRKRFDLRYFSDWNTCRSALYMLHISRSVPEHAKQVNKLLWCEHFSQGFDNEQYLLTFCQDKSTCCRQIKPVPLVSRLFMLNKWLNLKVNCIPKTSRMLDLISLA